MRQNPLLTQPERDLRWPDPEFPRKISKKCSKYAQNTPKIPAKYPENTSKIPPKYEKFTFGYFSGVFGV